MRLGAFLSTLVRGLSCKTGLPGRSENLHLLDKKLQLSFVGRLLHSYWHVRQGLRKTQQFPVISSVGFTTGALLRISAGKLAEVQAG